MACNFIAAKEAALLSQGGGGRDENGMGGEGAGEGQSQQDTRTHSPAPQHPASLSRKCCRDPQSVPQPTSPHLIPPDITSVETGRREVRRL
jgi:hypothetical protein